VSADCLLAGLNKLKDTIPRARPDPPAILANGWRSGAIESMPYLQAEADQGKYRVFYPCQHLFGLEIVY